MRGETSISYALSVHVCHLSWEYPPVVFGGLGRHVHALAEAQAAAGLDVSVVSLRVDPRTRSTRSGDRVESITCENVNGVNVIRVDPPATAGELNTGNLLPWVSAMQDAFTRVWPVLSNKHIDLFHGHDWMIDQAAARFIQWSKTPLITTIHATERGRHQGWLPTPVSIAIHGAEERLVQLSDEIIVCSTHMRSEVITNLHASEDQITIIPNGINIADWSVTRHDNNPEESALLVYCGRLEYEKGIHTLIDAVADLATTHPDLRLIIAGQGGHRDVLIDQVAETNLGDVVEFTGWLPEADLRDLMTRADALVIPSLYEPFGVVALEAAALRAPLVVSQTGGLAEFVKEGETGRVFTPGDSADLAKAVRRSLDDPTRSRQMAENAYRHLGLRYTWPGIAEATHQVYRAALSRHAYSSTNVRYFQ